jgi:antirestriction protein ArdC
MKGYTAFNAEQVEGLPAHFYAMQQPALDAVQRIERADHFFAATGAKFAMAGMLPSTACKAIA